jgi:DNA polymerase III subunit gamma/tau
MTHVVLARKYRPKTFSQVVGQDLIVSTLKAAITKDRVAHALLFTGGRGTGKTTVARLVAKAVVCLNRIDAEPCGACAQCLAIDNFSSLDVVEIDGASNTGVDDIRDLRDNARFQPTSARFKIYIIDEVHMLSINAFNALLKILEEPPAHVMFIFATTEVHKIPKTILSRCQRYDFRRVLAETIVKTLKDIGQIEGFSIADDGLRLIATLAEGGMRDALSMTEQIISNGQEHYSAENVASILGVVSHQAVKDLCRFLIEGNSADALLIIKEVYEKGFDLCQIMDAIAERFRVLSLCAHVEEKKVAIIIPSLDPEDFRRAQSYDKGDLKRLFAMALDGMAQVFQAEKPLLALELFVLRTALRPPIADAVTINYCLNKLDAIMHNRPLPKEPGFLATKKDAEPVVVEIVKPQVSEAKKDAVELFANVLSNVAKDMPALASHLRHARPNINIDQKAINLYFEQSLHYEEAHSHKDSRVLRQAIAAVFGQDFSLSLELTKTPSPSIKAVKTVAEADQEKIVQDKKTLYERASHDPLVTKALEIFGGDITEVSRIESHLTPGPRAK